MITFLYGLWVDPIVRIAVFAAVLAGMSILLWEGGIHLLRRKTVPPQSLSQAVARILWKLLVPLYYLTEAELKDLQVDLRAVRIQAMAQDLYQILPDTITVRFQGMLVPVPIKTILTEQLFMSMVTAALKETDGQLSALERYMDQEFEEFAKRGLTTERLMSYASPIE